MKYLIDHFFRISFSWKSGNFLIYKKSLFHQPFEQRQPPKVLLLLNAQAIARAFGVIVIFAPVKGTFFNRRSVAANWCLLDISISCKDEWRKRDVNDTYWRQRFRANGSQGSLCLHPIIIKTALSHFRFSCSLIVYLHLNRIPSATRMDAQVRAPAQDAPYARSLSLFKRLNAAVMFSLPCASLLTSPQ